MKKEEIDYEQILHDFVLGKLQEKVIKEEHGYCGQATFLENDLIVKKFEGNFKYFNDYCEEIQRFYETKNELKSGKTLNVPQIYDWTVFNNDYILEEKVPGRHLFYRSDKFRKYLGEQGIFDFTEEEFEELYRSDKALIGEWLALLSESEVDMIVADIITMFVLGEYSEPDLTAGNFLVDLDKSDPDKFYHIIDNYSGSLYKWVAINDDFRKSVKSRKQHSAKFVLYSLERLLYGGQIKTNEERYFEFFVKALKSTNRLAYDSKVGDEMMIKFHNFLTNEFPENSRRVEEIENQVNLE